MTKINTQLFKDDALTFKYDVGVDKQGMFTTTLPEEVTTKLMQVGIKLGQNRLHTYGFFSATSLQGLKDVVKEAVGEYCEKELVEEKVVIQYLVNTICSYCKGREGAIYPDGGWQKKAEGGDDYNWVNGTKETHSYNNDPFGFSVAINLQVVKVWKFKNGTIRNEYRNLYEGDYKEDELLEWLDSIRNIGFGGDNYKEITYSSEVGLFFKNMLLYVFSINEKIKKVFGAEFDLDKIDKSKLGLLGMGEK